MTTIRLVLVTLLGCAVLYPLVVLALAHAVAPEAATGSLLRDRDGTVIGSRLVAQGFSRGDYLWPRPSAVGYDATAAGGSNLASSNPELRVRAEAALRTLQASDPRGPQRRALASVVGPMGAASSSPVPAELVTASGSGLDPHVTLAGALWQAPRIARARHVAVERVEEVLRHHATAPSLGRPALVVVLEANLALDAELGRVPSPSPDVTPP